AMRRGDLRWLGFELLAAARVAEVGDVFFLELDAFGDARAGLARDACGGAGVGVERHDDALALGGEAQGAIAHGDAGDLVPGRARGLAVLVETDAEIADAQRAELLAADHEVRAHEGGTEDDEP